MSAWGGSSSFRSCDSLLTRLEQNDPTLQELVVLSTKSFGDAEVERLVKILESQTNTYWTSLSASGHAISNESLFRLGHAISKQTIMTSLAIGDKNMGDDGITALCDGLASGEANHPLMHLDLSYKGLRRRGLMKIFETLGTNSVLQRLDLSRNPSICMCRMRLREELAEGSSFLTRILELNLSDCNLDNEFVEDLQLFVRPDDAYSLCVDKNPNITVLPIFNNSKIDKLHVSECKIGDKAMELLMTKLDTLFLPAVLDLSKNEITVAGAASLALVLSSRASEAVQELDLSGNKLEEAGVLSIASALTSRGKMLASLDLSETCCGAAGAVAAAFESPVASLRLYGNNLGSEGFFAIAKSIAERPRSELTTLDLAGNGASASAVITLLKSVLMTRLLHLEHLVIGGNEYNAEVDAVVALVKAAHPGLDVAHDKLKRVEPTVLHS